MRKKIAIIDYGVGNVHSVSSALSVLGYRNVITRDPETIKNCDAYILPGVGAFSQAVNNLNQYGLIELLGQEVCQNGKPLLGICLGMQVLGHSSQESPGYQGLGWLDFDVVRLPDQSQVKVPHVGWNNIRVAPGHYLFKNLEQEPHFYFDHSYYVGCGEFSVARIDYCVEFSVAVAQDNIVGVQFHPEKSQNNGLKLFRNFFNYFGV